MANHSTLQAPKVSIPAICDDAIKQNERSYIEARLPYIATSSSHVYGFRILSELLAVYKLALSAFARRASVRLLSSTASCSLRALDSSFFRFFSSALCAFVNGTASDVFDLFPNGQPIPLLPPPPEDDVVVVNDDCDGDAGVTGIVAVVGDKRSVSVEAVGLRMTLVIVPVGECVSEG